MLNFDLWADHLETAGHKVAADALEQHGCNVFELYAALDVYDALSKDEKNGAVVAFNLFVNSARDVCTMGENDPEPNLMRLKPWINVPRDGSWVLPWHGQVLNGSTAYGAPVQWEDDGSGAMSWVDAVGGIEEDLDDIAKAFLTLPENPVFTA